MEALREAQRRQTAAEQARASLSRYFLPNLAERLASSANVLDLGGTRREVASLFTDLAGFTTLMEAIEPKVHGPLLNDYIVGMTDIVFAHDGTVAKIIGDALHVLFGAPSDQLAHLLRADLVPEAWAPRDKARELRVALRERMFYVRLRTMTKNRIVAVFDRYPEQTAQLKKIVDLFGKAGRIQLAEVNVSPRPHPDRSWSRLHRRYQ
ncbi:adenylate/guanylate cyclase family protein [Phyllobacterium brassicacearum]|nr:adenylate/guanylate cyclase family protein [Phyllobacterium brassicacearum]